MSWSTTVGSYPNGLRGNFGGCSVIERLLTGRRAPPAASILVHTVLRHARTAAEALWARGNAAAGAAGRGPYGGPMTEVFTPPDRYLIMALPKPVRLLG